MHVDMYLNDRTFILRIIYYLILAYDTIESGIEFGAIYY